MTSAAPRSGAPASDHLDRRARQAVWALVVYGLLLALSTVTHQPDPATDFGGYAEYVTTPTFLVSHLAASIAGAGIGIIGAVGLTVAAQPWAPRSAPAGLVAWVLGQCGLLAVFGVAAFAQPAIGRTFLGGAEQLARDVDAEVYTTPLFATAAVGLLLFILGAILLAKAAGQVSGVPRWATHTLWIATALFTISGFVLPALQPVAGVALAVAAGAIALALARSRPAPGIPSR